MGLRTVMALSILGWLASLIVAALVGVGDGVMCALPPASALTVALIRRGQISVKRAFIHGWHAGHHEATHGTCDLVKAGVCPVYLLSERRWTSSA